MIVTVEVEIPAPAKLLTLNAERSMHWAKRAEIVKSWREASCAIARMTRVPHFDMVVITARIEQHLGKLADPDAHAPVIKACVDGLVDAGVIDDDDQEHVLQIHSYPPDRSKRDAVILKITGIPTPLAEVIELAGVRFKKIPRSPEQMHRDREAAIAKEQKNCPHVKRVLGVCVECGHGASR